MKFFSSLISIVFLFPGPSLCGEWREVHMTNYQKAIRGLFLKEIRGNLPWEKMFDLCIPTSKRTLGRFTEYEFVCLPGYHGLTIIAKDGRLKRAVEWSCTYVRRHFDELTADDVKDYEKLRQDNVNLPFERCIGRWGWARPRMRDW
jgi:hypothetical protein